MGYGRKIIHKDINDATPIQAAVIGDVLLGYTYKELEAKYGVSSATIKHWCYQFDIKKPPTPVGQHTPLPAEGRVTLIKRQDIEVGKVKNPSYDIQKDMGAQIVEYVQSSIETLVAQLKVAGDPAYLKRQNAADLATLHRVVGDRAVELINALSAGQREPSLDDED